MELLPCLDSEELAEQWQQRLAISREKAACQSREVLRAVETGKYEIDGRTVDWQRPILDACTRKVSIPPWQSLDHEKHPTLPIPPRHPAECQIQVANASTLSTALELVESGLKPLVLNFANGLSPGGGFPGSARAQEEALCRCSALYWTLLGDPMYLFHAQQGSAESSDWAILSPDVPVFRNDEGHAFDKPVLIDFLSCAAPVATQVGVARSLELMRPRIERTLEIAATFGYQTLVLGAWGCGAFGNDADGIAKLFHRALESQQQTFHRVIFAITDWSPERRFLRPFAKVFAPPGQSA